MHLKHIKFFCRNKFRMCSIEFRMYSTRMLLSDIAVPSSNGLCQSTTIH